MEDADTNFVIESVQQQQIIFHQQGISTTPSFLHRKEKSLSFWLWIETF
jgi:alanine-alpha-ketoisovalerate/valine-pyruvate aminotransferase